MKIAGAMKIAEATLFALRIPFTESFSHSVLSRTYSDSIAVRVKATDGTVGYGEAVARPYVTGETVESCLAFMTDEIWPAIATTHYAPLNPSWLEQEQAEPDRLDWLAAIGATIPAGQPNGAIAWNAARTGFELALLDCLLKRQKLSLAAILPPKRQSIVYSGVITASSVESAVKRAKYFRLFGLEQIKVKTTVEGSRDASIQENYQRLAAIRQAVGPDVSLRIDGNGAYDVETAIALCQHLQDLRIDSAEQLIPRSDPAQMAQLKAASPIAIMVDESLITIEDAKRLINANACDFFNLRLAKCGGLARTIEIAQQAQAAGIQLQLGCQVGETAILSATGRHLAAWLEDVTFVEGSYGTLLLAEDISRESLRFGHGGKASLLHRSGLGIVVQDPILEKYAHQRIQL